jgi:TPR repeat protein
LEGAAQYYKLAADQGNDDAQFNCGNCLQNGKSVSTKLIQSAQYLKHSIASIADAQYRYALCLLTGDTGRRDATSAIHYLKLSAGHCSPDGEFAFECMAENGIGPFPSIDLGTAVSYYERCSDRSPGGAACFGWCLQTSRGISVDVTFAAECFKRAADSDDVDGINCFGCCLERGVGVDPDSDRATSYYQRAALLSHANGMYNFARCLEYGKGIEGDLHGVAKYYRLSTGQKNAAAQNSFGIFLE